jgi:ribonuclease HI
LSLRRVETPAISVRQPWIIHCDGSAIPNPGRMGLGAVLTAPDGTTYALSVGADARGCNNEAEARALMLALHEARAQGATALQIYTDSSLLVEQLGTESAPPVMRLAALYQELGDLLKTFAQTSLHWIPRHRNGEADALARASLGLPPKAVLKTGKRRR